MSDEIAQRRTLAFSPERMRAALWQDLAIPPALFQTAMDELKEQIHAKKVEYFTWHGEVISKRVVKDNAARLHAIDKVLGITGAYVKERDTSHREMQPVTIEIGEDGVHRIIIGSAQSALPPEREVKDAVKINEENRVPAESDTPLEIPSQSEALEVFRITKATPRENILQMFKDPPPSADGRIS